MRTLVPRIVLSALLLTAASSRTAGGDLQAGVARVDLTPPMELKATLGGYGARMGKPAVGVHDRVFGKAIVFSEGPKRFAFITADVLAFPPGFKDALSASLGAAGWKGGEFLLLPSHSHTSIDMSALHTKNILGIPQIGSFHKKLYELTLSRLVQAVTEAGKGLTPVSVGTRTIPLPGWNRNRRDAKGAVDPELTVTRIDKTSGEPLAVLVHWTAHPTFMDPTDMMFSGDYPGHLQRTVEAILGRGVTVLFYNGAEGDQSPMPRPDSGGNWEKAERYGRELGIVVGREWEKIRPKASPALAFHSETIPLPPHAFHTAGMKLGGAEYGVSEALAGTLLGLLFPRQTHSTSLRLGDLLIVGVPGEMTAELGLSVKSRLLDAAGTPHVVIGGLADEWIGYIVSAGQYRNGAYEASMSFYGETLGQVIADGAVRGATVVCRTTEK